MIYISFSEHDNDFASKLNRSFFSIGQRSYMDARDCPIRYGDLVDFESSKNGSYLCILVISRHSLGSEWLQEDLSEIRLQRLKQHNHQLIALLIDDCVEVPIVLPVDQFGFGNWSDSSGYQKAFQELCHSIPLQPHTLSAEAFAWYLRHNAVIHDALYWLSRNCHEIMGGLLAKEHYQPARYALEEQTMASDVYIVLTSLLKETLEDALLVSLMETCVAATRYYEDELEQGSPLALTDHQKVDQFRHLSQQVLVFLENIRERAELTLLSRCEAISG